MGLSNKVILIPLLREKDLFQYKIDSSCPPACLSDVRRAITLSLSGGQSGNAILTGTSQTGMTRLYVH